MRRNNTVINSKPSMKNRSWKSFTRRARIKTSSSTAQYGIIASLTCFFFSFYIHPTFITPGSLIPLLSWLTFKPRRIGYHSRKDTRSDTRRPKTSNLVIYYDKVDLIKDDRQDDDVVLESHCRDKTVKNLMADRKIVKEFNELAIYGVSIADKCNTLLNKTDITSSHNYPFVPTHFDVEQDRFIHKKIINKELYYDEFIGTHDSMSLDIIVNPLKSNHECFRAYLHKQTELYQTPRPHTHQNSCRESIAYVNVTCAVESNHPISIAGVITTNRILYNDTVLKHFNVSQTLRDESQHFDSSSTLSFATLSAISGFFGGAAAFLLTFPTYTLFVRRSMAKSHVNTYNRLFDGAILGTFATAISDAIYFKVYNSSGFLALPATSRSVIASFTNSIATSPIWVIVTHKQLMAKEENVFEIACEIYRHRGFSAFFDSLVLNLIMCIYPVVRQLALELIVNECNITRSAHVALAAALASIVATVATYPIQKWRIMLHSGELAPKVVDRWHFLSDGLLFKLLDTCLKTFILFLVKEHIVKYMTC